MWALTMLTGAVLGLTIVVAVGLFAWWSRLPLRPGDVVFYVDQDGRPSRDDTGTVGCGAVYWHKGEDGKRAAKEDRDVNEVDPESFELLDTDGAVRRSLRWWRR